MRTRNSLDQSEGQDHTPGKPGGVPAVLPWARWAARAGLLSLVFLGGMLFKQAGPAQPCLAPGKHSWLASATPAPAAAPLPAPTPAPALSRQLPTLDITIPLPYYEQIAAVREHALKLGILLAKDNVQVPATLRYEGVDMPVEISLKGDWTDHLRGDKWSFRIRMDNNYRLFGLAVFSIHNPPVRNYANEWGYMANLRRDDVLGLRYQFVNLVLNGQPKGMYALEEGFSKELFEAQGRREGLIMRYNEDLMWTYRALYAKRYVPRGIEAFYMLDEYQAGKIASWPGLAAQRQVAEGMLRGVWTGQLPASEAFDVELMGRFLALTNLWGGRHGLYWHNLRYYYNPLSMRIEPIGFNANALHEGNSEIDWPPEVFYNDPSLQAAYVEAALDVTSPDYLRQLEADLGAEFAALNEILEPEFGELPLPWDKLRERAQEIRQRLQPYQAVYAYLPSSLTGTVEVGNVLDWPVQLVGLESGDQFVSLERGWVADESRPLLAPGVDELALLPLSADARDVAYARIAVPQAVLSLTASTPLTVVTRLLGAADADMQRQPAWLRYPLPLEHSPRASVSLEQALAQHAFLERGQEADWLLVAPGEWTVVGDLVLPAGYGLYMGPGTTLRFGEGAILSLDRGPLLLEGRSDAPVLLTAAEGAETWGGIAVVEAGVPSALRHVTIEKTGGLHRPGWGTTAGVTFYKSPARLAYCYLLYNQTEDAINFVHSPFELLDSELAFTSYDALDSDFSTGLVERCAFHDTGNDGLDISGTRLTVRDMTATDIGDKAISVGENSQADVDGLTATRVYMGVGAKDGSQLTLRNAAISQALITGLAAYTKKPEYGPATITASAVRFDEVARQTLVQTGNWIDLDGTRVWGVAVDVEKLYLPFTKER
ncbi:MAG: hypothetical protein JW850_14540 [Thermoflexales bacterium]|nr:hypothetical protein [Thermoflexales bacterium]